jgi:hypothetical protein
MGQQEDSKWKEDDIYAISRKFINKLNKRIGNFKQEYQRVFMI